MECQTITASQAIKKLSLADPELGNVIKLSPPFQLVIASARDTYETLAESIVYQQLTGKAAASIFARLRKLTNEEKFPTPQEILALPDADIRSVGLSEAKTRAIIDLSRRMAEGALPSIEQLTTMSDHQIVESLTTIRGIGVWTVEMLLIFRLGRMDVMPATDYGVRKGFARTYRLADLPTPKYLLGYAEKWRPYRTVASWYMWRALENTDGRS
jgi:3-methyladenine DNA glycosylase/8-oxoguanine DNA glycosylase